MKLKFNEIITNSIEIDDLNIINDFKKDYPDKKSWNKETFLDFLWDYYDISDFIVNEDFEYTLQDKDLLEFLNQ